MQMDDYENQRSLVEEFIDEFNPYVDTLPDPEKLNYFAGETEFIGQFMVLLGSLYAIQNRIFRKKPHTSTMSVVTEKKLRE